MKTQTGTTQTALPPQSESYIQQYYPFFCSRVQQRLQVAARHYGDTSFSKTLPQLLTEMLTEAYDVHGWGGIAHQKALNTLGGHHDVTKKIEEICGRAVGLGMELERLLTICNLAVPMGEQGLNGNSQKQNDQ